MKIAELDTPVLLVDEAALDRNIARLKDMAIHWEPESEALLCEEDAYG